MANYEEVLNKPAFQNLEPERKEFFKTIMGKLDGKNAMEAMPIFMEFRQKMPKGKDLSKQEQSLMMEAILENMNEDDKQRFSKIIKMFDVMK